MRFTASGLIGHGRGADSRGVAGLDAPRGRASNASISSRRAFARVLGVAEAHDDRARPRARCRSGGCSCRAAACGCRRGTRRAAWSARAFMSTCSRKCTPPRRSSPRYIGSAPSAVSQFGDVGQQVERDDVRRVLRVGIERLGEHVLRLELRVGVGKAHLDADSRRGRLAGVAMFGLLERLLDAARAIAGSTLSVARALDTCTAGDSPKKLGSGVEECRARPRPRPMT